MGISFSRGPCAGAQKSFPGCDVNPGPNPVGPEIGVMVLSLPRAVRINDYKNENDKWRLYDGE